mmetsp:Transcript_36046/g.61868  ORF Transcript_36046/g.61868 Transcript_36046/m.61868 type:complete len:239 (+) Transcript_36046:3-719(+)
MPRLAQVVHPRTCVTKAQFDAFGEAGPQPPSEKQVAYAQRLAMQMATPLPEQALTNRQQCSDFIESMLEKAPASEKQLEFANSLAAKAGMSVPEHATQSSAAISKFIEGFGGGSRQGGTAAATDPNMPTEKQLAFAVKLARERRLGLSAEVLADKSACSTFIDSLLNAQAAPTAPLEGAGAAAAGVVGAVGEAPRAATDEDIWSTPPPTAAAPTPPAAKPAAPAKPADPIFRDDDIPF